MQGSLVFLFSLCLIICTAHAKKVTIIHTTDIHGWVAGHPHNATLDADFGDFSSLLVHMQANAASNDEEFFLFDTGDLIEGTGLSDATDVHGQYIFDIIQNVATYNALTIGNHDIGHPEVIDLIEKGFVQFWKGGYLTANSELLNNNYIGAPFTVFTTPKGTTVLVLGYLFNFTHEANNTIVVPVSVSLEQDYFKKAMQVPNVDLIVVCAHIAPQSPPELNQIYKAIRASHPSTPLAILSGHSHLEYFNQLDPNAFTIESGKYFEVIGLIQFDLESNIQNLKTSWVDTTVDNFVKLSGTTKDKFPTPTGTNIKKLIEKYQNILGLDIVYGCSPITYWPDGDFSEPTSLYQLLVEEIIPKVVFNTSVDTNTPFFITNSESLRYALYEGKVNRNDIYTISPFNDTYVYFKGIKGSDLTTIMSQMENSGVKGDRCLPRLRAVTYGEPWYFSSFNVNNSAVYDIVLALYDADTIFPIVQKVVPNSSHVPYPTKYNGTGALQAYIEQYFKCK
jgi:2',3'-cyclic-nucleotide 2'-phosphodiesterase (5'-nucleotidase family)